MTKNKRSTKNQSGRHEQWTVDIRKLVITCDDCVYLESMWDGRKWRKHFIQKGIHANSRGVFGTVRKLRGWNDNKILQEIRRIYWQMYRLQRELEGILMAKITFQSFNALCWMWLNVRWWQGIHKEEVDGSHCNIHSGYSGNRSIFMDYDFCRDVNFVQVETANNSENKKYDWKYVQWVRKSSLTCITSWWLA